VKVSSSTATSGGGSGHTSGRRGQRDNNSKERSRSGSTFRKRCDSKGTDKDKGSSGTAGTSEAVCTLQDMFPAASVSVCELALSQGRGDLQVRIHLVSSHA
jgi:hypothetical protein